MKKIVSLLVVAVMLCCMLPMSALGTMKRMRFSTKRARIPVPRR